MQRKTEKPLISLFLGKKVVVEVERGLEVKGRLVAYELRKNNPHRPNILIVENGSDRSIVRGNWLSIKPERLS